jgi:rhodanese-related sulfurtransferase
MPKLVNSWAASVLLKLARIPAAETRGERFLKLAAGAQARITEITPQEAFEKVSRGVVLIDVREKEEFRRGHIPRAMHLPRGTIEIEIERRAPDPDVEIITYCAGGNRSALVADNLQRMGYSRVRSVAGGFQAWLEAGYPASRDSLLIED